MNLGPAVENEAPTFRWTSYSITHVLDCIADPSKNRIIVELSDDISVIFPYLNAVYPYISFNPGANAVTVRRGERLLTFYPRTAIFAKVDGVEDAVAQLEWFRKLCLETWERRHTITPSFQPKSMLGPLDIYRLLPQSNCKRCGEATCMAFAVALLQGRRTLQECPPLHEPARAEAHRRLAELLGGPAR